MSQVHCPSYATSRNLSILSSATSPTVAPTTTRAHSAIFSQGTPLSVRLFSVHVWAMLPRRAAVQAERHRRKALQSFSHGAPAVCAISQRSRFGPCCHASTVRGHTQHVFSLGCALCIPRLQTVTHTPQARASDANLPLYRYIWKSILYPSVAQEEQGREERLRAMKRFYHQHCDCQSTGPRLLEPQLLSADAEVALGLAAL